jgi:hypothetical protein
LPLAQKTELATELQSWRQMMIMMARVASALATTALTGTVPVVAAAVAGLGEVVAAGAQRGERRQQMEHRRRRRRLPVGQLSRSCASALWSLWCAPWHHQWAPTKMKCESDKMKCESDRYSSNE